MFFFVAAAAHLPQALKRKEKYVRANDPTLLPIDRTVGNLLEWMPIFLGFFWMSMALTGAFYDMLFTTCSLCCVS
jgi:hypothetical protein